MTIDKTVNDFTIPLEAYPHLQPDQTLGEAIGAIQSFTCEDYVQFSELLILNEQNKLIGRVAVREILQALEPRLLRKKKKPKFEGLEVDYPNLAILWEESFFKECLKKANTPIKEFLSPIETTVKASDPLLKALYIMMRTNENNLPVRKRKKIIGVIRIKEVFTAVCNYCEL